MLTEKTIISTGPISCTHGVIALTLSLFDKFDNTPPILMHVGYKSHTLNVPIPYLIDCVITVKRVDAFALFFILSICMFFVKAHGTLHLTMYIHICLIHRQTFTSSGGRLLQSSKPIPGIYGYFINNKSGCVISNLYLVLPFTF